MEASGLTFFGLVSPKCSTQFSSLIFSSNCVMEVMATLLSLAVLVGGMVVKLPQLHKILVAKSVVGISELSVIVEGFSAAMFIAYNLLIGHPFNTWGEVLFMGIQNILIICLYWMFASRQESSFTHKERGCIVGAMVLILALFFACYNEHVDAQTREHICILLALSPLPLMIASRCPQILCNYRQQHTGEISILSAAGTLLGGAARTFSLFIKISDPFVLLSTVIAFALNFMLVSQIIYYWDNTDKYMHRNRNLKRAVR